MSSSSATTTTAAATATTTPTSLSSFGFGSASGRPLRQSTSHSDIRSSSSTSTTGQSIASPRERRRPSLSVSPSSFNASSLSSSSSVSDVQSTSHKQAYMSGPPSPPTPASRLEITYLAAKRRTHRQSYFDHYPERNSPRLREERKEATTELELLVSARKEKGKDSAGNDEGMAGISSKALGHSKGWAVAGENVPEPVKDTEEVGRPSIRKSVSLGPTTSSRKLGKDPELSSREEGDYTSSVQSTIPPSRPPRSARRTTQAPPPPPSRIKTHGVASSSRIDSQSLRTPKVPNHPYGAFRGDDVPDLRMSNSTYSSSQTHRGSPSPPQTPIESNMQTSSYEPIEVMVAPISDVEAMDAMVDGMDGSSDDDLFRRLQRSVAKGSFQQQHSQHDPYHHPLYAPPLPQPPEGVVLGRARPAGLRVDDDVDDEEHSDDELDLGDEEDEEEMDRSTSLDRTPFPSVSEKRREIGRTASSSTIVADMASPQSTTISTKSPNSSSDPAKREVPMSIDEIIKKHATVPAHVPSFQRQSSSASAATVSKPSSNVPTISEIIQRHTPQTNQKGNPTHSQGSSISANFSRQQRTPQPSDSESELFDPTHLPKRESVDNMVDEAQVSLRAYQKLTGANGTGSSNTSFSREEALSRRHSTYSGKMTTRSAGASIRSGSASASISKGTTNTSDHIYNETDILSSLSPSNDLLSTNKRKKQNAQRDAVATYLRSARITTLLKLTNRPHAAPDRPLTVSVSDLGSKTGLPLVVFLGLGCVRHVMGLYDEMAECMGLRLITIDRWGLGRTDVPPSSASRGVLEWATVVDEVLERLNVDRCCVMAHSAGSPYALAFANKYPSRIVGELCLLAPWIGGGAGGGYGWLKYVPNGILKTAQAAEWKIQAWMIGKPPKITYEGIGYNMKAPLSSSTYDESEHTDHGFGARAFHGDSFNEDDDGDDSASTYDETDEFDMHAEEMGVKSSSFINGAKSTDNNPYPSTPQPPRSGSAMGKSRVSTSSGNTLNEYDDLADFGGRFGSRSTFERRRSMAGSASLDGHGAARARTEDWGVGKKKKGFLRIWKGTPSSTSQNATGISNTSTPPVPPVPTILSSLGPVSSSTTGGSSCASTSGRLQATDNTQASTSTNGKSKLRTLRSIGSLRHRNNNASGSGSQSSRPRAHTQTSPKVEERSPVLPEQDFSGALDLGLDDFSVGKDETASVRQAHNVIPPAANVTLGRRSTDRRDMAFPRRSTMPDEPTQSAQLGNGIPPLPDIGGTRSGGRRSISLTTAKPNAVLGMRLGGASTVSSRPNTLAQDREPSISAHSSTKSAPNGSQKRSNKLTRRKSAYDSALPSPSSSSSTSYQVELGNALIAASHAESSRGTHPDLLQILNHERRPWGFSYARYPHPVRVWYGDRDERIAKDSVDWLRDKLCASGSSGGNGRCEVKVIKGADHGLMFRTDVIVEVLEHVSKMWAEFVPDSKLNVEQSASLLKEPSSPMLFGGGKFDLSPKRLARPSASKGTLRASWGYELTNDPFRAF